MSWVELLTVWKNKLLGAAPALIVSLVGKLVSRLSKSIFLSSVRTYKQLRSTKSHPQTQRSQQLTPTSKPTSKE